MFSLARLAQSATRAASSLAAPAQSLSTSARRWLVSSVHEARHNIFGNSLVVPGQRDTSPFKSLNRLKAQNGFKGRKIAAYYPKPLILLKHPIYRQVMNEERMNRLEVNRQMGKSPPKKGMGKRAVAAAGKTKK